MALEDYSDVIGLRHVDSPLQAILVGDGSLARVALEQAVKLSHMRSNYRAFWYAAQQHGARCNAVERIGIEQTRFAVVLQEMVDGVDCLVAGSHAWT